MSEYKYNFNQDLETIKTNVLGKLIHKYTKMVKIYKCIIEIKKKQSWYKYNVNQRTTQYSIAHQSLTPMFSKRDEKNIQEINNLYISDVEKDYEKYKIIKLSDKIYYTRIFEEKINDKFLKSISVNYDMKNFFNINIVFVQPKDAYEYFFKKRNFNDLYEIISFRLIELLFDDEIPAIYSIPIEPEEPPVEPEEEPPVEPEEEPPVEEPPEPEVSSYSNPSNSSISSGFSKSGISLSPPKSSKRRTSSKHPSQNLTGVYEVNSGGERSDISGSFNTQKTNSSSSNTNTIGFSGRSRRGRNHTRRGSFDSSN